MAFQGSVRVRRGLIADLPASAPAGELLLATDTGELWYGTGSGVKRAPGKQVRGWRVFVNETLTYTFPEAFTAPPIVTLTAENEMDNRLNAAELGGPPTATQCVIRAWRNGSGLTINSLQGMWVHVMAYGELA